jgi:hypothetical protein
MRLAFYSSRKYGVDHASLNLNLDGYRFAAPILGMDCAKQGVSTQLHRRPIVWPGIANRKGEDVAIRLAAGESTIMSATLRATIDPVAIGIKDLQIDIFNAVAIVVANVRIKRFDLED